MEGPSQPEKREVMQIRPEPPRPRSRLMIILILCLVVAGAVVFWRLTAGPTPQSAPDVSSDASTQTSSRHRPSHRTSATDTDTPMPRTTVPSIDLKWLQASTDYSVFIRTHDAIYRVQPHQAAVVRTRTPSLQSGGPVYFVPVGHAVVVWPLDPVPGWVVPDDGSAHRLSIDAGGGPVLPGPDPEHLWTRTDASYASLVGLDGAPTGTRARLPTVTDNFLMSDGQGYLLVDAPGGVYDVRPGAITRVANGRLLAVGPNRLLVSECDTHATCHVVLLDRDFTAVRSLPKAHLDSSSSPGVIAPNGRMAAFVSYATAGKPRVTVLDLADGAARRPAVARISGAGFIGAMAFSPDSRWLFVVGDNGQVHAVDVRTGRSRALLPGVEGAEQVTVRP